MCHAHAKYSIYVGVNLCAQLAAKRALITRPTYDPFRIALTFLGAKLLKSSVELKIVGHFLFKE